MNSQGKHFIDAKLEVLQSLKDLEWPYQFFKVTLTRFIVKRLIKLEISKKGILKNKYKNIKNKENIRKPQSSIISRNIHGKYLRIMIWEKWNAETASEDDFTVVSLQIPSNKQVSVHLKFYPAKPINKSIMIDYNFKFERYEYIIMSLRITKY